GSAVPVEDKLFATLDPATRRFEPVPGTPVLLTDTVGFIRRLPHSLIRAFRSTLEEAARASLIVHVLDASDPGVESCFRTTVSVLQELGAGEVPVVAVLNKIDRLEDQARAKALLARYPESLAVSAKNGFGLDALKRRIAEKLNGSVT
ncbi:MAG: 50S ribosome-binding GTPase, partial [Treponema sp.]|nr:50S ribosome-binding GTPase [Treponema sp.]